MSRRKSGPGLKKKFLFKTILLFFSLFICDCMIGAYLIFFHINFTLSKGLPVKTLTVIAHPYKAYINRPGDRYFGKGTVFISPSSNKKLNFELNEKGTIVDQYGHQVLEEDLNISNIKKRSNEVRMLFLGGSTTFQSWPFHLAALMNQRFKDKKHFVAINAGTGGYTSQENVIDLIISGFSYQPDIVIAYLPVNDIYWAAHYPEFKRDYSHMRTFKPYEKSDVEPPQFIERSYPFAWKLYSHLVYERELAKYRKKANLAYYTTQQPDHNGISEMNPDSFKNTVDAIIDNIFTMKNECAARGIQFILVTQKLFSTSNSYYTFMDKYTYRAIELLKKNERLKGIPILEMGKAYPDSVSANLLRRLEAEFDRQFDSSQELAYDSMHFSPLGERVFTLILADYLQQYIK